MTAGRDNGQDELARQVREVGRELEQARFGGANPVVDVPPGVGALEAAARALAAERHNARLRVDGREYNPREDQARADLQKALGALRFSHFSAVQSLLDRAGTRADEPALQQRIGLWKLLAQLVQRLVSADPEEHLRGDPGRWAREYLEGADRLSGAEREHYRAEVEGLVRLHAAASDAGEGRKSPRGSDRGATGDRRPTPDEGRLARTLWYVLRARLALAQDEPIPALVWCIRAAGANRESLAADEYLGDLLDRGRRYILLQLGEIPPGQEAATREALKGLQAWDLYHALTAQLGRLYALDVHRETARFSIAPYQDPDE